MGYILEQHRAILTLLIIISVAPALSAFDLNEPPPPDETMDELPSSRIELGRAATRGEAPTNKGRLSAEQLKKLATIYQKILKLFDVLKICDNEQFDIDTVTIPEKWDAQSKAIVVLAKVRRQGLIKKSDIARFDRIMSNCNKIQSIIQEREGCRLGLFSEMSGVDPEEFEKLRRTLEESPMDELKNRYSDLGSSCKITRKSPSKPAEHQTTVKPPEINETLPVISRETGLDNSDHDGSRPRYIEFF